MGSRAQRSPQIKGYHAASLAGTEVELLVGSAPRLHGGRVINADAGVRWLRIFGKKKSEVDETVDIPDLAIPLAASQTLDLGDYLGRLAAEEGIEIGSGHPSKHGVTVIFATTPSGAVTPGTAHISLLLSTTYDDAVAGAG